MASTVESHCNALARFNILPTDNVRSLRGTWVGEAGAKAADPDAFLEWLAARGVLTMYQVGFLQRGHAEQLLLGHYVLEDRIGKGRMAGVYRARHRTGQAVAIKILPPSKARDPQILGRFQREARLALRLKHPNIVRTFQAGEHNGLHFLVMEHLDGEPLDEVLAQRGKLDPNEAVRLVHQVLTGLEELREKGLVHRDIKPANLMLLADKPHVGPAIKILDIGTGRADFDEGATTELTNDGDLLGTPEYMSPEQARDPRTADIRADIYSTGCVLYHTLAGRPPFNDANRVRLLVKHATESPRPVKEFNPLVPDGLQQILDWMLAKDPAKRYPTPQRAADALSLFLAAGTGPAREEPGAEMRAFLSSLKTESPEDSINVELIATATPVQATPGVVVPVARPVSPPQAAPARPPVPVAAPVAPAKSGRVPAKAAPPPPTAPPPPPKVAPAKPKPSNPAKAAPPVEDEEEEEQDGKILGLSRRDLLMLLIGVGGLAVVLSIGLAIFGILNSRRSSSEE